MDNNEIEELAGEMYGVYCAAVGGTAYDGKRLPTWAEFRADPTKQKQSDGWVNLANWVASEFDT